MNAVTPRVFIAATRQNDGKTTTSLGLLAALQAHYPRIGYIKPVGQRFVEIAEQKIDEDTVLMDQVYGLNCPLVDMSPIAVEPDFTRKYLESANYDVLVRRIHKAFDRVAWEKDFVLCEGSGHAGVGSVFDLSNARVAKILGAKVIIVSQGGIGRPVDEVCLNNALFEKEGVEIIGVIINKVLPKKIEFIEDFARRGLKRKGLELLGVLPYETILTKPSVLTVSDELGCRQLNDANGYNHLINDVVVGAMSVRNVTRHLKGGALLITPGDREDILEAAAAQFAANASDRLAGIVLTGNLAPSDTMLRTIRELPFPVLLAEDESYEVASRVHDIVVKTRSTDTEKIHLIRDIIARHVNVGRILKSVQEDFAT
jgi:BioD-like phosphotransacetylase family protein